MENEKMKITPQDIIDREFRVKFRGFDMAEVDTFLEEVAESFFKLNEENILLNEKILALQQDLETKTSLLSQTQVEFPPEMLNMLEDLKQDTAVINTELGALKQDRQAFNSLREHLEKAIAAIGEIETGNASEPQVQFPADLADTLEDFKQNGEAMAAELAALRDDRQAVASLKNSLEEIIGVAKEAAAPTDLAKTLEGFREGAEELRTELANLKQEVDTLSRVRTEINQEMQEMLGSRFDELEEKLASSRAAERATMKSGAPATSAEIKEELPVADIVKEATPEKETKLPDYREDDEASDESDLEFLSEDDILDTDKLRGIFQSVLDEGVSDAHDSREGDAASADLLFLEEDLLEEEHEPEVSFGLDENEIANKANAGKP